MSLRSISCRRCDTPLFGRTLWKVSGWDGLQRTEAMSAELSSSQPTPSLKSGVFGGSRLMTWLEKPSSQRQRSTTTSPISRASSTRVCCSGSRRASPKISSPLRVSVPQEMFRSFTRRWPLTSLLCTIETAIRRDSTEQSSWLLPPQAPLRFVPVTKPPNVDSTRE